MNINLLLKDRLFSIGLAIRFILVICLVPTIHVAWFVPFIEHTISNPTLDPWASFIADGGNPVAYPYGPIMLLYHLPFVGIGKLADIVGNIRYGSLLGFRLSLLISDLIILVLLYAMFPSERRRLLIFYWLSPLVIYIIYWNGQTDAIPVSCMLLSLLFLKYNRFTEAGASIALAVAAKLSMLVTVPFLFVYLWRNKRFRDNFRLFVVSFVLTSLLVHVPFLFTSGFMQMVIGNREVSHLFELAVPYGDDNKIYITPLVYCLMLYVVWRFQRINFDLLLAISGLSFSTLVFLMPAPVGWYLWLMPFLVAHQICSDRTSVVLVCILSLLVVGYHFFESSGATLFMSEFLTKKILTTSYGFYGPHLNSLWRTAILSVGLIIIAQIMRDGIRRNDVYRMTNRTTSVGIAGDSGSGKDTLTKNLINIFGTRCVVTVRGDDYHLWDRHAPMWRALTHLDPRANNLDRFRQDIFSLLDGKSVMCRVYDHTIGRFTQLKLLPRNDFLIVSGLHTFYMDSVAGRLDLRIFLEPDEILRRHWKIERDILERGHSKETIISMIERRVNDCSQFIMPQAQAADIIFRLSPVNPKSLDRSSIPIKLKLIVIIKNGSYYEKLRHILVGICGLHVEVNCTDNLNETEFIIEGDVDKDDIAMAAKMFETRLSDIIDLNPAWENGMNGIMQLISLIHLDSVLRSRP